MTNVADRRAAQAKRHAAEVAELRAAIKAVLALHQPERTEYIDGDGDDRSSVDCSTCDNGGVPDTWPCPTVRALAAYRDSPDAPASRP